jgi:hypothetical protein
MSDFMEHGKTEIRCEGQYESPWTTRTFRVQVPNEANQIYLGCHRWNEISKRYDMEAMMRCYFYLDNAFDTIYFV